MAFLPIAPNWASTLSATYEFKTTVFAAEDGSEQRRALRWTPRRSLRFDSLLLAARWQEMDGILRRPTAGWHTLADVTRPDAPALTGSPYPAEAGTLTVSVDAVPAWLAAGAAVAILHGYTIEPLTVASVAGTNIVFATPLSRQFASGCRIVPVVPVEFAGEPTVTAMTDSAATVSLDLNVRPGSEQPDFGSPAATYDGRELWAQKPNWASSPQFNYLQPVERVDMGYGVVGRYAPIAIGGRVSQATYLQRGRANVSAIVDFFGRCRGRRGEFYAPTWLNDMLPTEDIVDGQATIRVTAPKLSQLHPDLNVYRDVYIETRAAGVLIRRVSTMTGGLSGSSITFTEPLPALAMGDVLAMHWLPLCRHATDSLTVEWITDGIANVVMSPQAIQWRPAE